MSIDPSMLRQLMAGGGLGMSSGPKALVEVKAGKMDFDGKMVTPDRRKGLIRIVEDASGMKQFQWCDPDTKNPIESVYVFPDETKFVKVKQSKDRVYLLEMVQTKQRRFYWFQEDDTEKDEELCKKIHNTLNNIAMPNNEESKDNAGASGSQSQAPSTPASSNTAQ